MLHLNYKNEINLDAFERFDTNKWEDIEDRISYKLMSKKIFDASENDDIIHKDCMDLTKVFIVSELTKDRKNIKSYSLKKEDLERFEKTEEDIYKVAEENMRCDQKKRIKTLKEDILSHEQMYPLMQLIENLTFNGPNALINDSEDGIDNVLIITNKYNVFGASYMLDFYTLREIYQRMNSNFYILPTSIHQFMCVSSNYVTQDKNIFEAEDDLLDMLFNVNNQIKNAEDILSYRIYNYIHDDGERLFSIKQQL